MVGNIQGVSAQSAYGSEPSTPSREPSPALVTGHEQSSVSSKANAARTDAHAAFQSPTGRRMEVALRNSPELPFRFLELPAELRGMAIDRLIDPKDPATSHKNLAGSLQTGKQLRKEVENHPSYLSIKPHLPKIRAAQASWNALWPTVRASGSLSRAQGMNGLKTLLSKAFYLTRDQRSLLLTRIQQERASYKVNQFGFSYGSCFAEALASTCGALPHFSDKERSAIFKDVMDTLGYLDKAPFFRGATDYSQKFSTSECDKAADFLLSDANKELSQPESLEFLRNAFHRLSPDRQKKFLDYSLMNFQNAEFACQTLSQQMEEQQSRTLNEVKELVKKVEPGVFENGIRIKMMSRTLQSQVKDHPQKFSDEIKHRIAEDFPLPQR